MSRSRDPLDTPGDWFRSIAASWTTIAVVVVAIAIAVAWGLFSTTGSAQLITGEVIRIEQTGSKRLYTNAIVRLSQSRQAVVSLPNRTNCQTGSKIYLIQRDNMVGRTFSAALAACPD